MRRVVVLGTGVVTLDALERLAGIGAGLVHLRCDGQLVTASANLGLDDPRIRRAQALALGNETGAVIVRQLLTRKLVGQLRVARGLRADERTQDIIRRARDQLALVTEPADFMIIE